MPTTQADTINADLLGPCGRIPENIGQGIPESLSWVAGFWRAGHANEDDRRRLGACTRRVSCLPQAAWGQGAGRPQVFRSLALFHGPQRYVASAAGRVRLLEQHLEALLALELQRRVRNFLRSARLLERAGASRADVRLDRHPRACVGGRRKRGQDGEALGRSRGGFSTKIHLKTDLDGYPIGF